MDPLLRQALDVALRDIRSLGVPEPEIRDTIWIKDPAYPSAVLGSIGGAGTGISVRLADPQAERLARVADQVQDWVIEELWSRHEPTNWPTCPAHPDSHPLICVTRDGTAVWTCPIDLTEFSPVGSLR